MQPPGIRHRVLEAGGGLEVVEVAVPAVHETFADPGCPLPNCSAPVPPREFYLDGGDAPGGRQRFVFFSAAARSDAELRAAGARMTLSGVDTTDTGILAATGGYASVSILSPSAPSAATPLATAAPGLHLLFAAQGSAELVLRRGLEAGADTMLKLQEGDAVALAPGAAFSLRFGEEQRVRPTVLEVTIPELV